MSRWSRNGLGACMCSFYLLSSSPNCGYDRRSLILDHGFSREGYFGPLLIGSA